MLLILWQLIIETFSHLLICTFAFMIVFPNCKINIGLNIVSRRSDGYHDLQTVFYPIYKLHDAIEILPQEAVIQNAFNEDLLNLDSSKLITSVGQNFTPVYDAAGLRFFSSGLPIEGKAETNLCLKAYHTLKSDFPALPSVSVCLHKAIPMGAGLGGGSADGAFTLQLLNQQFHLNLSPSQLHQYALQLGSDCPFFTINKPAFAGGRGEILEPVTLNLTRYSIVIIHPGIHVSTVQAFAGIKPKQPANSLHDLILEPIDTWRKNIANDFEEIVFAQYPLLQQIKEKLYANGASYAAMSGSGSAVYGIFENKKRPGQKLYPDFFELHAAL